MNEYKIKIMIDEEKEEIKVKAKFFEVDADGFLTLYGDSEKKDVSEAIASFGRHMWISIIKE